MKFTEGRGFGGGKPLFKAVSFPRFSFQKNFDNRHDGVRFDDREFENERLSAVERPSLKCEMFFSSKRISLPSWRNCA